MAMSKELAEILPITNEMDKNKSKVCAMNDCQNNRVVLGLQTKVGLIWFCSSCLKMNNDVLNGKVSND